MRVVQIQSRICVGGPSLYSIALSQSLSYRAGSRYDTLLIGGGLEDGESSMESYARERAVRIERVPQMRRAVRPTKDLQALVHMSARLRAHRPYIVQTHTAKAGAIGRSAALVNRVPIVIHTFHGHVFDGYFSERKARAFIQVERALARYTDVVLALSKQQRIELVDRYRIAPADKVRVMPIGVDLDRFASVDRRKRGALRAELGLSSETPLVVAVGRLVPIKRFDLLIAAFERVVGRGTDAHLVIAGDGAPTERAKLENAAQGISDRVHFLGWRSDTDILFNDADVFALTSDNEGTPVAVLEALVSGTPIVATRVGGVEDIVSSEMGELVEPGDVAQIAQALTNVLSRPQTLSDEVRRSVHERFSHRRLVRDTAELYDELIDRKLGAKLRAELSKEPKTC